MSYDPKKPRGYDGLARGNVWQQRIANVWKDLGFGVWVGWGHDEPDIVTFTDVMLADDPPERLVEAYGVVNHVVSVKTFHFVPSDQRFDEEGRHCWAVARTLYRKDVLAEVNYALSHRIGSVLLTIVNTRNEVAEHVELDCNSFQRYTTSQLLNNGNGPKEYTLRNAVQVEEDTTLGWKSRAIRTGWQG